MHESEKWKWSHSVVSDSSWPHGLKPTSLLRPWDSPGKSTGVGCHCLLSVTYLNNVISVFVFSWLKKKFIEVQLIYNLVLVSGVQQSDSVLYILFIFFRLFSIIGYYKIMSIVPTAIQLVLVGYLVISKNVFSNSICQLLTLLCVPKCLIFFILSFTSFKRKLKVNRIK